MWCTWPDLGIGFNEKARHAFVFISRDGLFKLPFVQIIQTNLVWGLEFNISVVHPCIKNSVLANFLAGSFALSLLKARDFSQVSCSAAKSQYIIGLLPFPPLFQNGRNMSEKDRVDLMAIEFEVSHQTSLDGGSMWSLNAIMPSNNSEQC